VQSSKDVILKKFEEYSKSESAALVDLRVGGDDVSEKVKEWFEQINIKLDGKELMTESHSKIMDNMIQRLSEMEAMCQQVHVDRKEMLEKEKLRINVIEREVGERQWSPFTASEGSGCLICLIEEVPKFHSP
jgi:hypothetical protein